MNERDTLGEFVKWLFTDLGGIVFLVFAIAVIVKTSQSL